MIDLNQYIDKPEVALWQANHLQPWEIIDNLENIVWQYFKRLGSEYEVKDRIAIHKTATIEAGVTLKGTMMIGKNSFIGAHAYLRGPLFLGNAVKIGPCSEIKQSIILDRTAIAHFNYIGNSILGQKINFEAGAICANHYNERQDKQIYVKHEHLVIDTKTKKFGSLIGDHSKIGANAVLSPGTILEKNSVVKRLELIEQIK